MSVAPQVRCAASQVARRAPRVLYIVYWGAGEVTGEAWILSHVRQLASLGAQITLVTFEKPEDLARLDEMRRIAESLRAANIKWIQLTYHKSPKIPATAFDVARGVAGGVKADLRGKFDIIHARTFIGGIIGLLLKPLIGARLVYHNEGFYPDEQVDGGIWAANSLPHRVAKRLEIQLYASADAIISMSRQGKRIIEQLPAVQAKRTPIISVPACVNLEHFRQDEAGTQVEHDTQRSGGDSDALRLIYIGSVGGRYLLEEVARFAAQARKHAAPRAAFLRLLTKYDATAIAATFSAQGLPADAWSINSVPHSEIPNELRRCDAGLFFLKRGLSERGCSPTKIGEYWAAGLPIVTTPGAGDIDEIVSRERVGVIVRDHSDAAYEDAVGELLALLEDEQLSARCRQAATAHYSLLPAIARQFRLYEELLADEFLAEEKSLAAPQSGAVRGKYGEQD